MTETSVAAAAVVGRPRRRWIRWLSRTGAAAPWFIYSILIYATLKLAIGDLNTPVVSGFSLTWFGVLFLATCLFLIFSLLSVAKPGIDESGRVISMMIAAAVYLILFMGGLMGIPLLRLVSGIEYPWSLATDAGIALLGIFGTVEFSLLVLIAMALVPAAQRINASTLKRTIDYTDDHDHSH